jgi:hypothetical protein
MMGFAEQIAALAAAPLAWIRVRGKTLAWLLVYALACTAVLGLCAYLLVQNQDDIRKALLSYIFPESWHLAAGALVDRFLASQQKAVLINAIASGSLVLVSVLLFPLKEKVSATFEREGALTTQPIDEFPLWRQGLEEAKLLAIYVAAQLAILWVGYHPDPTRKTLATVLSYLYLYATFTIDFCGPLLQRHQLRYSRIIKLLASHPLLLFGLGGLLTLPPVLTGLYVTKHPELPLSTAVWALFAASVVAIVWGVIAGTWLASRLLEAGQQTSRPHGLVRAVVALLLVALLTIELWAYGAVALAFHHKSQILKCNYSVLPTTLRFERPKLLGLLRGRVDVGVRFDLRIENPTRYDVSIENNRLEVRHAGSLVASGKLAPMAVPGGKTRVQTLSLSLSLRPAVLAKGRALLKDKWSATLYIEVAKGLEFPIYLRHTFAKAVRKRLGVKE